MTVNVLSPSAPAFALLPSRCFSSSFRCPQDVSHFDPKRINVLIVLETDESSCGPRAIVNDDSLSDCIRCCRVPVDCRRIAGIACSRCSRVCKAACIPVRHWSRSDPARASSFQSQKKKKVGDLVCILPDKTPLPPPSGGKRTTLVFKSQTRGGGL